MFSNSLNYIEKAVFEQRFSSVGEWHEYSIRMANANHHAMEETNNSFRFQVENVMSRLLKRICGRD